MVTKNQWNTFVSCFKENWLCFHNKDKLVKLVNNNEDLAVVISQLFVDPYSWILTPNPSLNGKSPSWCIKHGMIKQIQCILMSMP